MIPLSVGATDTSIDVQIVDDTGLPVTGLVASTFPTVKYSKATGADATISLSDLAALTSSHSDGGVKERGEGVYRLDLPDAVASTLAVTTVRGETTNKRVIAPKIVVGPIPNAAAGATGGLATVPVSVDTAAIVTALGDRDLNFLSPVLTNEAIEIVQGSDYYTQDGRDIEFNFAGTGIPVQGNETCTLTIASGQTISITANATLSSGSGSQSFHVAFQIPRATGDLLDAGAGTFEVFISINSHEVPLVAEGKATIRRRLS